MKNRILAALTALALALGLSMVTASPAQAAFGGVTAANSISFYQWTGLGAQVEGDRWQTSYSNIINAGGCLNLAGTWANGTSRNDNTGSAMWKTTVSGYEQYAITVFNWSNCNAAGQFKVIGYLGSAGSQFSIDNLNDVTYSNPAGTTMKLYHTITSIGIRCVIC